MARVTRDNPLHFGDDEPYVLIEDAIGQGVDVRLYANRGIVSVILVSDNTPIGASAEIEFEDLDTAIEMLRRGL